MLTHSKGAVASAKGSQDADAVVLLDHRESSGAVAKPKVTVQCVAKVQVQSRGGRHQGTAGAAEQKHHRSGSGQD